MRFYPSDKGFLQLRQFAAQALAGQLSQPMGIALAPNDGLEPDSRPLVPSTSLATLVSLIVAVSRTDVAAG